MWSSARLVEQPTDHATNTLDQCNADGGESLYPVVNYRASLEYSVAEQLDHNADIDDFVLLQDGVAARVRVLFAWLLVPHGIFLPAVHDSSRSSLPHRHSRHWFSKSWRHWPMNAKDDSKPGYLLALWRALRWCPLRETSIVIAYLLTSPLERPTKKLLQQTHGHLLQVYMGWPMV